MKVHIGYLPILEGKLDPSPGELVALGAELGVRNPKLRLGLLTGDIDREQLAVLRMRADVKWVEVDQERRGR